MLHSADSVVCVWCRIVTCWLGYLQKGRCLNPMVCFLEIIQSAPCKQYSQVRNPERLKTQTVPESNNGQPNDFLYPLCCALPGIRSPWYMSGTYPVQRAPFPGGHPPRLYLAASGDSSSPVLSSVFFLIVVLTTVFFLPICFGLIRRSWRWLSERWVHFLYILSNGVIVVVLDGLLWSISCWGLEKLWFCTLTRVLWDIVHECWTVSSKCHKKTQYCYNFWI